MKSIIGTLAYLAALTIVILASLYDSVPLPITTVAVIMLVLGALWAWTDPAPAKPVPCDCPACKAPRGATTDDVR